MKVFHHNDIDGICAAHCVDVYYNIAREEVEYIEMDYEKKFPFEVVTPGELVWIVDFSILPEEMRRLLQITTNVIWIDHHRTAIDRYAESGLDISGLRRIGISGAALTYMYISGEDSPIPEYIQLISDYDTWTHKDPRSLYFVSGLAACEAETPTSFFWKMAACNSIDDVVEKGKIIEKYKSLIADLFIEDYSYEINFEGHTCLVANTAKVNSTFFGGEISNYDMCIVYVFDGTGYRVSLYSVQLDVSEIAKKYGGGGHRGAAGFYCTTLPWRTVIQ